MLLITHDLGVVAEICERVRVMYAGDLVEEASVDRVFAAPQHHTPTDCSTRAAADSARRIAAADHRLPGTARPPDSCPFAPRCPDRFRERATRCFLGSSRCPGHRIAASIRWPAASGSAGSRAVG